MNVTIDGIEYAGRLVIASNSHTNGEVNAGSAYTTRLVQLIQKGCCRWKYVLFWRSDQLTCGLEKELTTSVKKYAMDKKNIHKVKLPRINTAALYAIAIGLLANVFKPVLNAHPAFAASSDTTKIVICDEDKRSCKSIIKGATTIRGLVRAITVAPINN